MIGDELLPEVFWAIQMSAHIHRNERSPRSMHQRLRSEFAGSTSRVERLTRHVGLSSSSSCSSAQKSAHIHQASPRVQSSSHENSAAGTSTCCMRAGRRRKGRGTYVFLCVGEEEKRGSSPGINKHSQLCESPKRSCSLEHRLIKPGTFADEKEREAMLRRKEGMRL